MPDNTTKLDTPKTVILPAGYQLHPTPLPNLSPTAPAPVQRQVKPVLIQMAKPEDKTGIAIQGAVYGDLTGTGQAPHTIPPAATKNSPAGVVSDAIPPAKGYSVAELKKMAATLNPSR